MGFARTVAIKCLHSRFSQDGELSLMLLDEARVAARIQHPYVVPTLDVVSEGGELLVVMEYVHGESLSKLQQRLRQLGRRIEPAVAVTLMVEVLQGLHAAHEVVDESGHNLGVVHRDVSPQNVLVGVDGIARVLDFGIAKAFGRAQTTREGQVKGKLAYMSPEQVQGENVDRRTDVFAASVVLWELLTGDRLFGGDDEKSTIGKLLRCAVPPPSTRVTGIDAKLDALVLRGLAKNPADRYSTAHDMALGLESWSPAVPASRLAAWVDSMCHDDLAARRALVTTIESGDPSPVIYVPGAQSEGTKSAHSVAVHAERSGRLRPLAWALPLALAAGVGTTYLFLHRYTATIGPSGIATAPPPTVPSGAGTAAPSGSDLPMTAEVASTAPTPSATAPPRDGRRPGNGVRHSPPSASQALPGKVDCTTPYTLDAEGHKHYRRECLHE
jgi:hypothetical protein